MTPGARLGEYRPRVVRALDPSTLADTVADRFLTLLASRTATMQDVHVVLTGGTVAALVHRRAASLIEHRGNDVRWEGLHVWWGDERWVGASSDERNDHQVAQDLLAHLPLEESQIHRFPAPPEVSGEGQGNDPAVGAQSYSRQLAAYGPNVFDLVMLGAGPDGHVASLFPDHPLVMADPHVAAVLDCPKPPRTRLTLTESRLARTDALWVFATGTTKADALGAAYHGGALPLASVSAAADAQGADVTWFVDDEAGSLLEE